MRNPDPANLSRRLTETEMENSDYYERQEEPRKRHPMRNHGGGCDGKVFFREREGVN